MGRSLPPSIEYAYTEKEGQHAYPWAGVTYIKGDVTDKASLTKAMKGVTAVFHTAAHYGSPPFGMMG